MEANEQSKLAYVEFKGFNTLREPGWTLTGAVTFYESDVWMRHCRITDNLCEDALNTVRSHIDMDELYIANTAFDGFDADFCDGLIKSVKFNNTGNDAIDFSGSKVVVHDCLIENAGDKGISAGEQSNLEFRNARITGCNIAIASKDRSECLVRHVDVSDCKQGFTAYQKKPEFGPAFLNVMSYTTEDVKQPYLIERGSVLMLESNRIEGE